jgi:hypothetical protein
MLMIALLMKYAEKCQIFAGDYLYIQDANSIKSAVVVVINFCPQELL